jgi:hypothetical protein
MRAKRGVRNVEVRRGESDLVPSIMNEVYFNHCE